MLKWKAGELEVFFVANNILSTKRLVLYNLLIQKLSIYSYAQNTWKDKWICCMLKIKLFIIIYKFISEMVFPNGVPLLL